MEEEKNEQEKAKHLPKTGVIPNEQLKGSDADKAYDVEGNFLQSQEPENDSSRRLDPQEGSDADTDNA
jgi:hypothetical protein